MEERDDEVTINRDQGVLEIIIDRPKVNAIDFDLSRRINEAVVTLRDDPNLHVGLVTAAGDRIFSAGWDLKALNSGETNLDNWWLRLMWHSPWKIAREAFGLPPIRWTSTSTRGQTFARCDAPLEHWATMLGRYLTGVRQTNCLCGSW